MKNNILVIEDLTAEIEKLRKENELLKKIIGELEKELEDYRIDSVSLDYDDMTDDDIDDFLKDINRL